MLAYLSSPARSTFLKANLALLGAVAGLGYWLLESMLHAFVWHTTSFLEALFAEHDSNELWMRITVVVLMIAFGWLAERGKQHFQRLAVRQQKLNRLLHFLSDVNQYVQRLPDEQSMLDAVCRAATEIGEFRFAWVGMQRPEGFTLAAWASAEPALNEHVVLLEDHAALLGCSNCRNILETGAAQLCDINAKLDCPALWKEALLSQGCKHAYALPIKVSGKTVGVFEVFAGEDGILSGEECSILEEVADDVSVALNVIEQEKLQQQAKGALKRSEALNTSIVTSAIDGIISMNSKGRIVEFNPAAEVMFGYRRSEVIGELLADRIIPPDMRDRHTAGLKQCLETGEGPVLGVCLEVDAMHADGHQFPVELCLSSVSGEEPPLFIAILRDITERRETTDALQQRLDELERFQRATVDREFRIKELRDEVEALRAEQAQLESKPKTKPKTSPKTGKK